MRWFRLYTEMLDDEKVQMLTPELFKTWVNLLCVAASRDGILPPVEKLAFKLRVSSHDMQSRIEDLIIAGLIDVRADKSLQPHNWERRQWKSDDSAERVRKHRETKRSRNDDVTVTVTPPEADKQIPDTDYVPSPSLGMPREKKQNFNLSFGGSGSRALSARLKTRAEGLGLNVAALEARALAPGVRIPNAMFRKLVVDEIRSKQPIIAESLIKAALGKDGDAAYGNLLQMLVEFA